MKRRTKTDIQRAYDNVWFDIDSLMNLMEMELSKSVDNPDWGHVGTLRHIRHEMLELTSHLTGRPVSVLQDALEEMREDLDATNENA